MIINKRETEHYEKRSGGKGTMHIERLLPKEALGSHVRMYAKVTVDVNSSLGLHTHSDDSECYFILQGKAKYNDNGNEVILQSGDCAFAAMGESHAIENIGDEPLIFMALIIQP